MENLTDKPLFAKIKPSCGCVFSDKNGVLLEAKKKQKVTLQLYSNLVRGSEIKHSVTFTVGEVSKVTKIKGKIKKAYVTPNVFVLDGTNKIGKSFTVANLPSFPKIKSIVSDNENIKVKYDSDSQLLIGFNKKPKRGLVDYVSIISSQDNFPVIKVPIYFDSICQLLPMNREVSMNKLYNFIYTSPSNNLDISKISISEGVLYRKRRINDYTWQITLQVPKSFKEKIVKLDVQNNLKTVLDRYRFTVKR